MRCGNSDVLCELQVRTSDRLDAVMLPLKFRRYAAVAWLVEAGASNRAGVSWAAVFPVTRARRQAMIMSSVETWRLWRYQGAARRREPRSAAGWPAWSYHRTRMVRFARPRGVVRWTAVGSRLWASPVPRRFLPSLIDCSMTSGRRTWPRSA